MTRDLLLRVGAKLAWVFRREITGRALLARLSPAPIEVSGDTLFLVTSTLRPTLKPLGGGVPRTFFRPEERIAQTVASLESIRARAPGARVILLENSQITAEDEALLRPLVDAFIPFVGDPVAACLRDRPNKGAGEVWMLLRSVAALRPSAYHRLFKLSGRYCLNDSFTLTKFPVDRFGLREVDGMFSTRLYCVPKLLERAYERGLHDALRWALAGAAIEWSLFRKIPREHIAPIAPIGVIGGLGLSGELIDE